MKTIILLTLVLASGCASYPYSKNVKMVSFEEEVEKGKSVGPIRGQDCTWSILGYQMGGDPTLDKAFANARSQADSGILSTIKADSSALRNGSAVRYINNVSTENDGFNAYVVGKKCLVVKGTGYL